MAYSPIEQKYLDTLAMAAFPEAVDEPMAEPSLEGMQLAAGPSETRTDAGPRFGRGGVTRAQSQAAGGLEKPLGAMLDMGAATVKGGTQQFIGTPGDFEGIARTVINLLGGNVDENTVLPTTDEIKTWLDKFPITRVGDGKNPYETIGEVVAPGGYVDVAKAGVKGAKAAGKALAPAAADVMKQYLTKTGAILKAAPDSPGIEVKSAPKLNTPAFKNWFGDSKVVDDKGKPLVMYHGTKHQFEAFDPNIGYQGAMFFSPKREFAENYMGGMDVREPIAVYISAKNPFDFDNPKHRQMVIDLAIEKTPIYKNAPDQKAMHSRLDEALINKDANWATIEDSSFQAAIKELGFDAFYVRESGVKNLAVYDPTQIKSVFNKGTFDPKDPRILYGGGVASTGAAMQDNERK